MTVPITKLTDQLKYAKRNILVLGTRHFVPSTNLFLSLTYLLLSMLFCQFSVSTQSLSKFFKSFDLLFFFLIFWDNFQFCAINFRSTSLFSFSQNKLILSTTFRSPTLILQDSTLFLKYAKNSPTTSSFLVFFLTRHKKNVRKRFNITNFITSLFIITGSFRYSAADYRNLIWNVSISLLRKFIEVCLTHLKFILRSTSQFKRRKMVSNKSS